MKKIILIRHGQTIANLKSRYQGHTDNELTELGLKQAKELAKILKKRYLINAVFTSPLIRAFDTANAVAKSFKLEPFVLDELKEIDFGKWDGLTYDEIALKYPISKWLENPLGVEIDGGENWMSFINRINAAFKKIASSEFDNIAVVSHAGVIRFYLAGLLNLKGLDVFNFQVNNGSFCEVVVNDDRFDVNFQ